MKPLHVTFPSTHLTRPVLPGIPANAPEDPTVIARIARPFGHHGEVKVVDESAVQDRFSDMDDMIIRLEGHYRSLHIDNITKREGIYIIKVAGVDDPETAALLSGAEIVTSTKDRPHLPETDYYIDDLLGSMVVTTDGEELGLMVEVIAQGHHDLWVVDGADGEILIPAVKQFIARVDKDSHRIIVNRIEGLWD